MISENVEWALVFWALRFLLNDESINICLSVCLSVTPWSRAWTISITIAGRLTWQMIVSTCYVGTWCHVESLLCLSGQRVHPILDVVETFPSTSCLKTEWFIAREAAKPNGIREVVRKMVICSAAVDDPTGELEIAINIQHQVAVSGTVKNSNAVQNTLAWIAHFHCKWS